MTDDTVAYMGWSLSAQEQIDGFRREVRELKAENAKLRELASGLHKCLLDEGCEGCPMQDDDGWCVRDIRLHELGVGVTV